jgi:hypothetical protein
MTKTWTWTKEWPTKPGWYWFYGWPYGRVELFDEGIEPELNVVNVWKVANGLAYIRNGNFWYKEDKPVGLFCPMDVPELPSKETMEGLK